MDVKQAVGIANAYLADLFPTGGAAQLEEVERLENGGWQVTFSYEPPLPDPLGIGITRAPSRVYKVVTVDSDGTPLSVKMR